MFSPSDQGFDEISEFRDRTQMYMVAGLARTSRLILKGGMAMRAIHNSTRLTKDVDYDCPDEVPDTTLRNQVNTALLRAAVQGGLMSPQISELKMGSGTARWRLVGQPPSGGAEEVRWEVEVSRRGPLDAKWVSNPVFTAPRSYRIPPFPVRTYSSDGMLALKIRALLAARRDAPRDVHDLYTLMLDGTASPRPVWTPADESMIVEQRGEITAKVEGINHELVLSELSPYLPQVEREALTEEKWAEMQTVVCIQIEKWFDEELADIRQRAEQKDDPQSTLEPSG